MSYEITPELARFLDDGGRLKQYPSKQVMKTQAQAYLASKFEPGKRYTEREVSELLKNWHTFSDPATLRRDIYDAGFINRTPDCREYWVE